MIGVTMRGVGPADVFKVIHVRVVLSRVATADLQLTVLFQINWRIGEMFREMRDHEAPF